MGGLALSTPITLYVVPTLLVAIRGASYQRVGGGRSPRLIGGYGDGAHHVADSSAMPLRWMCSLTFLFALPLAAQEEATTLPPTAADGQLSRDDAAMRSRFGLWGGVATHSPVRARYGVLHRDMFLLGIRGSWGLVGSRYVTLRYAVDFIPLAISTNNPSRIVVDTVVGGYTAGTRDSLATSTTYGVGVAPLRSRSALFPRQRLGVLVEGTGRHHLGTTVRSPIRRCASSTSLPRWVPGWKWLSARAISLPSDTRSSHLKDARRR